MAKTSNADRREAAREQARLLREEQAKREKRNRMLIIIGAVALLALVAAAIWAIVSQGNRSSIEQLDAAQVPANTQPADGGISVGAPLAAGTANDGAPVVDVYLDYLCTYCLQFEDTYTEYLDQAAESGEATVVYHPVALLDSSGDYSQLSGHGVNAAATVAAEAPEHFLAAHAALVGLGHQVLDSQGSFMPTGEEIAAALAEAGVPQDVADRAGEAPYTEWVEATTTQFGRDGFRGTPTILIDGEELQNWPEPNAVQDAVQAAS